MALVIKALLLTFISLLMRVLENVGHFVDGFRNRSIRSKTMALYSVLCLYIPIGIGIVGYFWAMEELPKTSNKFNGSGEVPIVLISISVLIVAALIKGFFSKNQPRVMEWSDIDWRCGVIIPNGLAFSLLTMVVLLGVL